MYETPKLIHNKHYLITGTLLDYAKVHVEALSHNERLWSQCFGDNRKMCYNPEFLSQFCSLFPFQTLKTVRLRVNLTRTIIEDSSLNVQVLLLVRDPRATLQWVQFSSFLVIFFFFFLPQHFVHLGLANIEFGVPDNQTVTNLKWVQFIILWFWFAFILYLLLVVAERVPEISQKMGFLFFCQTCGIFDDRSKFRSAFVALHFEKSWNMAKIWQKMKKSLVQLAFSPFFVWFRIPKNPIFGYPESAEKWG